MSQKEFFALKDPKKESLNCIDLFPNSGWTHPWFLSFKSVKKYLFLGCAEFILGHLEPKKGHFIG